MAQRQAPGGRFVFLCRSDRGENSMAAERGYEQFVDDDEGYLRWLRENPAGLVVNSHRVPVAGYLVLHRASCKHINSPNRTNWTTTGYIKTCLRDGAALADWAKRETGGSLSPCGACKPVLVRTPRRRLAPRARRNENARSARLRVLRGPRHRRIWRGRGCCRAKSRRAASSST